MLKDAGALQPLCVLTVRSFSLHPHTHTLTDSSVIVKPSKIRQATKSTHCAASYVCVRL